MRYTSLQMAEAGVRASALWSPHVHKLARIHRHLAKRADRLEREDDRIRLSQGPPYRRQSEEVRNAITAARNAWYMLDYAKQKESDSYR